MDRKMMQRIILIALALVMLLSVIAPAVMATDTEATETTAATAATEAKTRGEFECGDDLVWSYADGKLTISGSGAMDDYKGDAPWAAHKKEITKVVLEGVTYVGAKAFNGYDAITEVDFGTALKELGAQAFRSCEGLTEIYLPKTFKIFGEESLNSCTNLKEIHCDGVFPSFKQNCLWGVYANIYYPAAAPWSVTLIEQLEEAFHGRIQFLASDGTDHFTPTEATTEETTEVTTEATTEPVAETAAETTAPVTEAATEATTEAITEATTEAATEATTEAIETSEETMPETSEELAPAEKEGSESKAWIGLVIMGSVVFLLVLGGLAFGGKKRSRGKFSKRR